MTEEMVTGKGQMSIFEKILNVFIEPRKTFENLYQKPDWIIPTTILVVVMVVFTMLVMPIALPEQMEKQRQKYEERGMTDQEIERAMAVGEKAGKIIGPISSGITSIVVVLVVAGVLLFIGNIILGGESSYKKMLAVVAYSSMIGILNLILLLPLILSKQTMNVNFSLAAFLSADSIKTITYQLLSKVDFFSIWNIFVTGIGFSVMYKFSTKKSIITIAVLYTIYAVVSAFLATKF